MKNKYTVLVIGGGTAGIMTAAQLKKKDKNLDVAIIEPSEYHYYQPAWTLVGVNEYDYAKTRRSMQSQIPQGVTWIKDYAEKFHPEKNTVTTRSGSEIAYDFLVVAPGLVMAPELVEGLTDALDKGVVCSNYTDPENTWRVLQQFKGGTALFTQPTTPIKCGGAPQKIMYLAEDYFNKSGKRKGTDIVFATAGSVIFGVKPIAKTLMEVVDRKDINLRFGYNLVGVDGQENIAWYEMADHEKEYNHKDVKVIIDGKRKGIKFDMLHLAPPQAAPKFIRESPLVDETKWISVDKGTMQHTRFKNIFGLGDAAGLPTAKTGAAVRKQVPVIVENLMRLMAAKGLSDKRYDGYSSCPLVTDIGKMVLAEFDYDNNFTPDPKLKQLLIRDSSKEHWRLWMLKKYILPYLYWNKMMKGIDV
ncbi:MAG: pyridine nucleotide-disulfide oxidoreductase [Bacteroidetes bacterium]|nr:MAG: pyridine nucleotide-disulfide oxidoreductase [Bacteroidota bacterium]PTM14971.1 MAG: pyridine nucleotide-disulfide oxidoreductase [Bacteroidota bacterium]